MKIKCIITNQPDYSNPEKKGIVRFSNTQWITDSRKLEGHEFGDVIVRCAPDCGLKTWLHMQLGVRIDRIIYSNA
jgi:hypothetical protein